MDTECGFVLGGCASVALMWGLGPFWGPRASLCACAVATAFWILPCALKARVEGAGWSVWRTAREAWAWHRVRHRVWGALKKLSRDKAMALGDVQGDQLVNMLSFASELAAEDDIPAQVNVVESQPNAPRHILGVDIGGTRTKFMVAQNWSSILCNSIEALEKDESIRLLPAMDSKVLWAELPRGADGSDHHAFDSQAVAGRICAHLQRNGVDAKSLSRIIFSVPGTVELNGVYRDRLTVVKNMPSFSRRYRGLDFQKSFGTVFHEKSKISAISDNMGAALGAACLNPDVNSALVLVLGTAPAVATFFRDPSGKDKYLETGIWQSWVWFSKIQLDDEHGYCGGVKVDKKTGRVTIKPPNAHKIPHRQSRIRFALDNDTWLRLRGKNPHLPSELQPPVEAKEATRVWAGRVQATVNKLAAKFHGIYGSPDVVYVLGGNATRCHGRVTRATYQPPDTNVDLTVPVVIPARDEEQQLMHLSGLVYSTQFKVKQVFAPGQDPFARGWTRGGEICMWVKRKEFRRKTPKTGFGGTAKEQGAVVRGEPPSTHWFARWFDESRSGSLQKRTRKVR